MVAGTMKNSTEFLKKTKNQVTIWSSNPTPRHTSRKDEHANRKRYMHPNVHRSTVYNSQDVEANWTSTDRGVDKEDAIHTHTHTHTHTHWTITHPSENEILPFVVTWMDLEIIVLSEVSQIEKRQTSYGVIYTWNLKNNANGLIYKTETDLQN